jgi:diaminopimelate epimerase
VGAVSFEKYQATGNDFLVVEARRAIGMNASALARDLCHRREGVGADGLLWLTRDGATPWSVAVYNADGSLAETSGNGLRCAFRYLLDHDLFPGELAVESGAGPVQARHDGDDLAINMGPPRFEGDNLPPRDGEVTRVRLALGRRILCGLAVSMGNPHLVIELDGGEDPHEFPLEAAAEAAEASGAFVQGVNVEVVRRLAPDRLEARVWERGVGETRACGSGACATVAALSMLGTVQSPTEVRMPGGVLQVSWRGAPPEALWLSGPAIKVFTGSWEGPAQRRKSG